MTEISPWGIEHPVDPLFIHFDVEGHFLRLNTFIQTAESARNIIMALDVTFFEESLEYEFVVLPPEDGSFLTKLALWVTGGVGAIFTFLNSDIGVAYVEGLTGRPPVEWAQEFGQKQRDGLQKLYEEVKPSEDSLYEYAEPVVPSTSSIKPESEEAACQSGAQIILAMTRGLLEKETWELVKIGMGTSGLFDALTARAEFYTSCMNDGQVKRIGFEAGDDFPIPRNSFAERAQKPTREKKEDDPPEWILSIESIYVTSPNWDQEDQIKRQWKGKDQARRDCYFLINDAIFWNLVKARDLNVAVLDNLKVHWACQYIEGKPKNRQVLRVLEFNGTKLAEPLTPDEIQKVLGSYSMSSNPRSEPSLFDGLE
jgi:hypothetical protein